MESIRKLSSFSFQWTKTLYQGNLNINYCILFYIFFFKGYMYRCNQSTVITLCKDYFTMGPEKINVNFHKNCENTGKILQISTADVILLNLTFILLGSHKKFSLVFKMWQAVYMEIKKLEPSQADPYPSLMVRPGPRGYCHIWAIQVCAAVQRIVFEQFTLGQGM